MCSIPVCWWLYPLCGVNTIIIVIFGGMTEKKIFFQVSVCLGNVKEKRCSIIGRLGSHNVFYAMLVNKSIFFHPPRPPSPRANVGLARLQLIFKFTTWSSNQFHAWKSMVCWQTYSCLSKIISYFIWKSTVFCLHFGVPLCFYFEAPFASGRDFEIFYTYFKIFWKNVSLIS